MIVMNKNVDIKPLLMFIGNKFKNDEDDDFIGEDESDSINEEDLVMVDVEEITNKVRKN
jgi:hypothetical protein